jgi:hypothetical protein
MDTLRGRVTEAGPVPDGSTLTAAITTSDTVLPVARTADFDTAGGFVQLGVNGPAVAYSSVDATASTVTLVAASPVAMGEGDNVILWDPETGQPVIEYVAMVLLDEQDPSDRPIEVTVQQGLVGFLNAAVRAGAAETVTLVRDGEDNWMILQIDGKKAVVDEIILGRRFATGEDGQRVEISGGEVGGGFVRFYTGNGEESWPGFIQVSDYGVDGDHANGYVAIKSPAFRYEDDASISLISATADGSYGPSRVVIRGTKIEIGDGTDEVFYLRLGMALDANGKNLNDVDKVNADRIEVGGGGTVNLISAGEGSINTNGSGIGTFTHGLGILFGYTVQITSRDNANTRIFNITAKNTNNFQVRVDNDAGSPVASATGITFDYLILG